MNKQKQKQQNRNSIFTIRPYKLGKLWVFDEPNLCLIAEAFVGGTTEAITEMLRLSGAKKNITKGFSLAFSDEFFPDSIKAVKLPKKEQPISGTLYEWKEQKHVFWLCNVLGDYFSPSPNALYAKVIID